MKRLRASLASLALALAFVVGTGASAPVMARAAPTSPTPSAGSPTAPVPRGTAHAATPPHLFLMRGAHRRGSPTTPNIGSSNDLNYYGGSVLHDPKMYVIFWGSSWNSGSDATAQQIILKFFQDVGQTGYNNILTQYYGTTSRINKDISLAASTVDPNFTATDQSCGGPTVYTQDVINEVVNVATAQNWSLDPNNGIYFVYTPAGSYVNGGGSTPCSDTVYATGGYCAFHTAFAFNSAPTTWYAFAAMPYPNLSACKSLPSFPNNNTTGDAEVNVSSHEMSEAITDPVPAGPGNSLTGWVDSIGQENGDKCAWMFPTANPNGTTTLRNGGTFAMQLEYSNTFSSCQSFARTWYFAEGYIGPGFSEYLTLENPTSTTANVVVEYLLDNNAAPVFKSYTVTPNARNTIFVNSVGLSQNNVSLVVTADQPVVAERPMYFTYNMPAGGTVASGSDVLGATDLATQYTFGYLDTRTSGGSAGKHDTYLTILNPNPGTMSVTVTYYPAAGGSSGTVVSHSVTPNARGTIWVNGEGLAPGVYTAVISLSLPGLVERPLYLVDGATGYSGAADVVGTTASAANSWYFAEGTTYSNLSTGLNFSERYLISNPGSSATTATVTFLLPNGTTPSQQVSVPAHGLSVVDVNAALGANVDNSAVVTAPAPIVAERFMSVLFPLAGGSVQGATDVIGTPRPASEFQFAEGYTNPAASTPFDEYLTLENPNAGSVGVTIRYLPTTGGVVTETETVAAHSRMTIFVNNWVPNQSLSIDVTATSGGPIVAERPMYFNYHAANPGATDVIGFVPPDAA